MRRSEASTTSTRSIAIRRTTTVPGSCRSSAAPLLAAAVFAALSAPMSAHRRDEYLQAARIALAPDYARIDLDLTPGIAVAETVLADIDRDRSGTISADEARDYAGRVRQAI